MRRKRGRPRLHDWHRLFERPTDSSSHEVVFRLGTDFTCTMRSMEAQIRNQASARGVSVIVQRDDDEVRAVVL